MKKFNLFKEIIVVQRADFMRAVNSSKHFAITYEGKIAFEPFEAGLISIYEGSIPPLSPLATNLSRPIPTMLGDNYRIVEDDDRILIKATGAWQSIIRWNRLRSMYDDTTADGIDRFSDQPIEDMGMHATEFHIPYRDIVEQMEAKCDGLILCIEQEEPYQFSGLGFVFDAEQAREVVYDYCAAVIREKIATEEEFSTLNSDEEDAAVFFKAI